MEKLTNNGIFVTVYQSLMHLSEKTGISYTAINIIIYYLIIPLSWAIMLDYIIQLPICTSVLLIGWTVILILTKDRFYQWCNKVFSISVKFLLSFRFWSYTTSSVVICVIVPIIIYIALFIMLFLLKI